ncbi:MAG TPA: hypothetical protein VNF47_24680 [Streptosporangiaceae bacterium]|nr:hypothetical protein [Streptosporangiaceae bacterium]
MPSNCDKSNSGEYAVRHNPPPYYTTLSGCATFDVPYTRLASDLAGNTLPAFSQQRAVPERDHGCVHHLGRGLGRQQR